MLRDDYARRTPRASRARRPRAATSRTTTCSRARSSSRWSARSAARVNASGDPGRVRQGRVGPRPARAQLRYAPFLEMADRHVIYKQAAKEIAAAAGLRRSRSWRSSTSSSPAAACTCTRACGADGEPAFAERREPLRGQPGARADRCSAGCSAACSRHARELRAGSSLPTSNSYKRYRAGTFAPTGIAWSVRQPHRRLPHRRRRPVAARRVPHPRRRRESLPRLRGHAGRRPRRHRAQARAAGRPSTATPTPRPTCPACRARCPKRSPSCETSRLRAPRLRRRRGRAPAALRPHRAGGLRHARERRRARTLLRTDLSVRGPT